MDTLFKLNAESEIRNLIALYAQNADDGDAVAFASRFTAEGTLSVGGQAFVGRPAIQAWLPTTLQQGALRHFMMNIYLAVDTRDTARCSLDMLLLKKMDGEWKLRMTSRYEDRLVHTDAGWLFAQRNIQIR
ncbi:conserved hypothetical protein [Pseudomonas sp. 9AZ]|uniref:nuclear transport factor 2 family protein n=1 Tax=Pseudomonas sp. 9AZ TaxID=2653168 RepID=UPI0012F369C7|nr:nuclear transport factor 2 family protein [Pseudomonas sp. 9AZ]VXD04352.1 conserved hypothetical protein [Pseudomonas sp. 9AZ]